MLRLNGSVFSFLVGFSGNRSEASRTKRAGASLFGERVNKLYIRETNSPGLGRAFGDENDVPFGTFVTLASSTSSPSTMGTSLLVSIKLGTGLRFGCLTRIYNLSATFIISKRTYLNVPLPVRENPPPSSVSICTSIGFWPVSCCKRCLFFRHALNASPNTCDRVEPVTPFFAEKQ